MLLARTNFTIEELPMWKKKKKSPIMKWKVMPLLLLPWQCRVSSLGKQNMITVMETFHKTWSLEPRRLLFCKTQNSRAWLLWKVKKLNKPKHKSQNPKSQTKPEKPNTHTHPEQKKNTKRKDVGFFYPPDTSKLQTYFFHLHFQQCWEKNWECNMETVTRLYRTSLNLVQICKTRSCSCFSCLCIHTNCTYWFSTLAQQIQWSEPRTDYHS